MSNRVWKPMVERPPGAWKIWARTNVAGTRHRADDVERFLTRGARSDPSKFGLSLQPDPKNPYDENAIRVYGYVDGERFHLGFVPADLAKELTESAPPDMPIFAQLQCVYRGDYAADITFHILVPAQRHEFWRGRDNPFAGPSGSRAVWTGPRHPTDDDDSEF